jgi:ferredoxin
MTSPDISQTKDIFSSMEKLNYMPLIEEVSQADGKELREYRKGLQRYFLREKKTTKSLQIKVAPVLLAPYLRGESPEMVFPAFYDQESHGLSSLQDVLQEILSETFNHDDEEMLSESLPSIVSLIQEKLGGQDQVHNFTFLIKEAVELLRQIDVHHIDTNAFHEKCDKFGTHLLKRKTDLIEFSKLTAFKILNLQLKKRHDRNQAFLNKIKKCISALNEILLLHGHDTDQEGNHFEFAGELVSFDKIADITSSDVSSDLPEERLNRLRKCNQTLVLALKSYSSHFSTIFVSSQLAREFALKKTMTEAILEITSEESCTKAKNFYNKEIRDFVRIIAALRLADLEIDQKYDEDLHTPYFEGFDISYLSDNDIQYFRSRIVVEESRQLPHQPSAFMSLLSEGAPVNVLAVNRLDENKISEDHIEDEDSYLELAALAIFRRNAYVFQGAAHTPSRLYEAFNKGLDSPIPALWNLLFTKPSSKSDSNDFLALKTAIESRYFPSLVYDIRSGEAFGSHFDLSGNPQPEHPFPSFQLDVKSESEEQIQQYSLTMADYLAMSPDNLKKLEVLPLKYQNDDLIPLSKYLVEPQDSLAGKIPFIWMVDEQNILKQAAIPVSWLQRCRARLDYWYFLQELGGVNSYHVNHALVDARSDWEAIKNAEIEELKATLKAEFNRSRTQDIDNAIKSILNALLDSEDEITSLLMEPGSIPDIPQEELKISTEDIQVVPSEDQKTEIRKDVWIESDECTSCNDCIDLLPSVFKYNDDKQAIVHNPEAGTYAKIVASAEKCPAACIHPGLPHNTSEKGLEKLIKRAEKFN